jgi:hypothetical protein
MEKNIIILFREKNVTGITLTAIALGSVGMDFQTEIQTLIFFQIHGLVLIPLIRHTSDSHQGDTMFPSHSKNVCFLS